jgi:hypothetical protein
MAKKADSLNILDNGQSKKGRPFQSGRADGRSGSLVSKNPNIYQTDPKFKTIFAVDYVQNSRPISSSYKPVLQNQAPAKRGMPPPNIIKVDLNGDQNSGFEDHPNEEKVVDHNDPAPN